MTQGIILDRDGTLIEFYRDIELGVVTPAFHADHVKLLPGVVEGLKKLGHAGYQLAVATNQPDAAKGRVSVDAIERTNTRLVEVLTDAGISLAGFETCLHHPDSYAHADPLLVGPCECRKPAPGMLLRLMARLELDPKRTWMVGDTLTDGAAAGAAGLHFGLLAQAQRCEICPFIGAEPEGVKIDARAPNLTTLADEILALSGDSD